MKFEAKREVTAALIKLLNETYDDEVAAIYRGFIDELSQGERRINAVNYAELHEMIVVSKDMIQVMKNDALESVVREELAKRFAMSLRNYIKPRIMRSDNNSVTYEAQLNVMGVYS